MESFSDEYYIERVIQGDHSSFATLVERHKDMVFTIASRMLKNNEEAEEVAQDAFLKAFKSLKKFRKESKFSTWIYRIVYNLCVLRRNKENFDSLDDENRQIDIEDTDKRIDQLEVQDRKLYINRAIGNLKYDEKTILTLYYQNDLSVDEIAQVTQLSHSNVKVRLHRARQRLYIELNGILKHEINTLL